MSTSKIEQVTAIPKANVYFDGQVVSHTLLRADGSKLTLGLIYPGEYHFGTQAPEDMEIVAGSCDVVLDGQSERKSYAAGSTFHVPGNSGFTISVSGAIAEYICSFR
jgi:hypothetical protein